MAEDYKLIDNEEKHRYEFQIDDKIAEIDYIKSNNGEIYLVHTEVPASLGGKGVGSQLAEKVLSDIERQGLRLVPLCPFVAGYIHKHPEWKRIVMRGKESRIHKWRINHHMAAGNVSARRNMRKNVTQCISPERKTVGTN